MKIAQIGLFLCLAVAFQWDASASPDVVSLVRVPNGGIQPQAVAAQGVLHLVYLKGKPEAEDIYYVHKPLAGNAPFSAPIRVNSVRGSATAAGSIRGAQLAVGRRGRVYVAWNGSDKAPKGPGGAPILYARMTDSRKAFTAERNLITWAGGIDGGCSLAADNSGHVYVTWHACTPGGEDKDGHVYLAQSNNDGLSFARERKISTRPTGACSCCDMRAFADNSGRVFILYRAADQNTERATTLLTSRDGGKSFRSATVQKWPLNSCPLSTFWLTQGPQGVLGAWETQGQVYSANLSAAGVASHLIAPASGTRKTSAVMTSAMRAAPTYRKYPLVIPNAAGRKLFAWVDGATYMMGPRALQWRIYDRQGKPTGQSGRAMGVPLDSVIAAYTRPDGRFVILY